MVFLVQSGTNVNSRDISGATALFHLTGPYASELTHRLAERLITDFGADVNAVNREGHTAIYNASIMFSAPKIRRKSMQMLIRHGANNVGMLAGNTHVAIST
jgi:ankyrin repeat protein